jgi:hypothetical protein
MVIWFVLWIINVLYGYIHIWYISCTFGLFVWFWHIVPIINKIRQKSEEIAENF